MPRANAAEGAYLSSQSVRQGDTLSLYCSSSVTNYTIVIARLGSARHEIASLSNIHGLIQPVSDSAFYYGCHWLASTSIVIPPDWQPGIYEADVPTGEGIKQLIFAVRPLVPASNSRTLVCLSVNTWQAYNNWGGKSLYNYNSKDSVASVKVSFDRPYSNATDSLYFRWTHNLVQWMDAGDLDAEFCTNLDLDKDPLLLSHYDVFVIVGHDEYWTHNERHQTQEFVDRGGRMIVLSGNTCWWQARLENDTRTLVCFRNYNNDPYYPSNPSLTTVVWSRNPVNDPPNKLFGANFEHGGYVDYRGFFTNSAGYGGYTTFRSWSWIFDSTELADGDIFGQPSSIVGYECDGSEYKWRDGLPIVTGLDSTPNGYHLLGLSPTCSSKGTPDGAASMGLMTNRAGGAVFNVATTNWTNGLADADSSVCQITRNVFRRFRSKQSLPPEIVSYSPVTISEDSINHQDVTLGHRTIQIDQGAPDVFSVHATDPVGMPLRYRWTFDGHDVGHDSIFVLTAQRKQKIVRNAVVDAFVTNGQDTVSIEWYLVDTMIRFVTMPPSASNQRKNRYAYRSRVRSCMDEHPKITMLDAPPWVSLSRNGILTATLDVEPGIYPVTLLATDRRGNKAEQVIHIFVIDTTLARAPAPTDPLALATYPNPFHGRTSLLFSLKESSAITLQIWNAQGMLIRSVLDHDLLSPNQTYEFIWDGTDDRGDRLPSGIYFIRSITGDGQGSQMVTKIVKD